MKMTECDGARAFIVQGLSESCVELRIAGRNSYQQFLPAILNSDHGMWIPVP
jgi:hypothetical protein